ncbi:MAG TPA: tRNA uridine-5-carboxymethylaminomethyl(34) synthesis GTPase MnmE [Gemmatimonadales bacterium]|nr:tRNA uridine-5-carboxymethylaminomethyl(34) synthesis GTPase MnmE [Gemmatimonadales bacterium]
MLSDPIVALATPPGRSAVALLRLSGRGAFAIAERCLSPWHPELPRSVFRSRLSTPGGVQVDDVLAVCFPAPNSYTGEDLVEISTHGGLLAPAEALGALVAAGARPAEAGEFTRRAVLNGKLDLLQAEATADLIDASAPAQRRRALVQLDQGLSKRLEALRSEILELEGLTAYEIDFPEEDDGPVAPERVVRAWEGVRGRLVELLGTAAEGERLREGALLVIAGPPNAGKSTLFNALLGSERAIVTEVPGTTRDAIEAPAVIAGFPFRLVDTAGLRHTDDRIEKLGIEVSRKYLGAADLVLYCDDGLSRQDAKSLSDSAPVIEVRTKSDLLGDLATWRLSVSALTGAGIQELRQELARVAFGKLIALGDVEPVVTRARHRQALETALSELGLFNEARSGGVEAIAAATHIRAATGALDSLIGAVTPDDVLERVFSNFCVGK